MATRTISKSASESGFGLLGMVLVILITLTSVFITAMMVPMMATRQVKETQTKGKALLAAIAAYKANNGAYPATLSALVTTTGSCNMTNTGITSTLTGWCGPYLDQSIVENANGYETDGWGTLFVYSIVPNPPTLSSCGPDRTCGNGDDIAFIVQ